MAERGPETLRFGPMKPVGLADPHSGRPPYAVVQLRQDNALGTLYNMVGFQTKLKHGEQTRIFRTLPGLQNAEFARLGGLHRNTFLNSPKLLDAVLRLKACRLFGKRHIPGNVPVFGPQVISDEILESRIDGKALSKPNLRAVR